MSCKEFIQWMAIHENIFPIGESRNDARLAYLLANVLTPWSREPLRPKQFVIDWERKAPAENESELVRAYAMFGLNAKGRFVDGSPQKEIGGAR